MAVEVVKQLEMVSGRKVIRELQVQADGATRFSLVVAGPQAGVTLKNCITVYYPGRDRSRQASPQALAEQLKTLDADPAPLGEYLDQEGWSGHGLG